VWYQLVWYPCSVVFFLRCLFTVGQQLAESEPNRLLGLAPFNFNFKLPLTPLLVVVVTSLLLGAGPQAAAALPVCDAGHFYNHTGQTCGSCWPGYECPQGSTNPAPARCPVGKYTLDWPGVCTECPAGTCAAARPTFQPRVISSGILRDPGIIASVDVRSFELMSTIIMELEYYLSFVVGFLQT
jgi:hypothetical protein